MKSILIILSIIIISSSINPILGQTRDSTLAVTSLSRDSFYFITENIPKNKFWGNSWYVGGSFSFSKSMELTFNFGRTYGKSYSTPGGFGINMKSWGLGYSYFTQGDKTGQTLSGFGEISNFFLPPGTVRLEYIYDVSHQGHYIRPSLGLNLNAIDILYHYSFKLSGEQNNFKHGFTLRFKFFINKEKNWQKTYIKWIDR